MEKTVYELMHGEKVVADIGTNGVCTVLDFGRWHISSAQQIFSIVVVAIRRYDAETVKTPFNISVSMEITPPVISICPTVMTACLSKKGLNIPATQTSGSTTRILHSASFTEISFIIKRITG